MNGAHNLASHDPVTAGERMLAGLLQQAALREASLLNTLTRMEVEVFRVTGQLAEAYEIMTPKQREKLSVGVE